MADEFDFARGTTGSSTLNTYEGILALAQNPAFLLQQGFITPEEMLQYVQSAINEPILRPEDWDTEGYRMSVPTGDVRLQGAFDLLDNGMTVGQVMAKLYEDTQTARGGELTSGDLRVIEELRSDVVEYERRLKNANEKDVRIANGEWFEDPSGIIYTMGDDARQILASLDLGGIAGIPQMWQPILDAEMQELARKQLEQAETARQSHISGGKKAAKETQAVAQKAYMDFMKMVPKPAAPKGAPARPTNMPEMGTREYQEMISRETEAKLGGGAGFGSAGASSAGAFQGTPRLQGNTNEAILSRMSPQQREVFAKMAASYAGRAAQETSGTQKQAQTDRKKSEQLFAQSQESGRAAIERARIPALEALMQGPAMAAMMAQPAPKPVRPQPRTLSDAEIEIMANMIAGGMQ